MKMKLKKWSLEEKLYIQLCMANACLLSLKLKSLRKQENIEAENAFYKYRKL